MKAIYYIVTALFVANIIFLAYLWIKTKQNKEWDKVLKPHEKVKFDDDDISFC